MKLHGATPSPFYRKCRTFLEEKGIRYEAVGTAPFPKTPELLARHPMGKIPYLIDGELTVPDSSVICAYLEKIHPSPALYPDDPAEFSKALFLEEYADAAMQAVFGGLLSERLVKPIFFKEECDEARVAAIVKDDLPGILDYVESRIPEDRDTLLSGFGIADIAVGSQLGSLAFAKVDIDAARWPRTAAYQEALLGRPSFKTAMT